MLASIPASTLNQSLRDLGIPNRFTLKSSRFRLGKPWLPLLRFDSPVTFLEAFRAIVRGVFNRPSLDCATSSCDGVECGHYK